MLLVLSAVRGRCALLWLSFSLSFTLAFAQGPPPTASSANIAENSQLSDQYVRTVNAKLDRFNTQAVDYTRHSIDKLIAEEKKMQRKMAETDLVRAKKLFDYSIDSLQKLKTAMITGATGVIQRPGTTISPAASRVMQLLHRPYFPYLDTLKQSLTFLKQGSSAAGQAAQASASLEGSLQQVDAVEGKLNSIGNIQTYISQRQQVLENELGKLPQFTGNLQRLNQDAYYYSAQIKEYKTTLSDPTKVERKALDLVEQSPAFQRLMQNNGQLAGLFAPRASFGSLSVPGTSPIVNGLPSRAMLQQFIKTSMPAIGATDPVSRIPQQMDNIGDQLEQALHPETGGSPGNHPATSFTPNSQKTKPFGKRLEWGFDVQFGRAYSYLPTTANFGIKVGYKLNDRFTTGIGIDYLMGAGTGWKNIQFTNQGLGVREYTQWQIKKGWNIQGGAEFNYMTAFSSIVQLRGLQNWQTSALLGICKTYKVSKKINGNFQLLYDFLYRQHQPTTQPLLFRLGYDLP